MSEWKHNADGSRERRYDSGEFEPILSPEEMRAVRQHCLGEAPLTPEEEGRINEKVWAPLVPKVATNG